MLHKTQEEVKILADNNGIVRNNDGSWENTGDFDSYYCYWCLDKFSTYDDREIHEVKCNNRKIGYSAQMDPDWLHKNLKSKSS
jgi:hypothetical protein